MPPITTAESFILILRKLGRAKCANSRFPNARLQAPPIATATQERRLSAVACKPLLGAGSGTGLRFDAPPLPPDFPYVAPPASPLVILPSPVLRGLSSAKRLGRSRRVPWLCAPSRALTPAWRSRGGSERSTPAGAGASGARRLPRGGSRCWEVGVKNVGNRFPATVGLFLPYHDILATIHDGLPRRIMRGEFVGAD